MISHKYKIIYVAHIPRTGGTAVETALTGKHDRWHPTWQKAKERYSKIPTFEDIVDLDRASSTRSRTGRYGEDLFWNSAAHSAHTHYKKQWKQQQKERYNKLVEQGDLPNKETPSNCWDIYFKFSIVRNPFDWLVSLYHHNDTGNFTWRDFETNLRDGGMGRLPVHPPPPFRLPSDISIPWLLRSGDSQYEEIVQSKIIGSEVDYVLRYENLKEDFNTLCNLSGITDISGEPLSLPVNKIEPTMGRRPYTDNYYTPESIEVVNRIFAEDMLRFGYSYHGTNNE